MQIILVHLVTAIMLSCQLNISGIKYSMPLNIRLLVHLKIVLDFSLFSQAIPISKIASLVHV